MNKNQNEKSGAFLVGLGIFLSRIAGLVRERVFAHYFGNSDASDAFKAALKIPNFLQNLLGEGVLSASFIPVYANLITESHNQNVSEENKIEAAKVASVIGSLLFLVTSILVIIGIFATPFLIDTIAPGFKDEKRALTIKIVQIFFPGTGLAVMGAWCLGILNSHRKFFLSYVAPVVWSLTQIVAMILFGKNNSQYNLTTITAWGLVIGSFLQFIVQVPFALKLLKYFKPSLNTKISHVRIIIKNFFPALISRGVVQVSAYIDALLASLLPSGAVSALAYAQTIYLLPISLFGMSITASELPTLSSFTGNNSEEVYAKIRTRLNFGLQKIAFYIVPSVCAFIILGNIAVAAIFQTGHFTQENTNYVWYILIGSTVGLLASTLGRLYSSTFYALKDTRTPLKFAIVRVILTTLLGIFFAFYLPDILHVDKSFGTAGLTASAGIAGWIEFFLLRKSLNKMIGDTGLLFNLQIKLWISSLISAILALAIKFSIHLHLHHVILATIIFGIYGISYFAITYLMNIEESVNIIKKIAAKLIK